MREVGRARLARQEGTPVLEGKCRALCLQREVLPVPVLTTVVVVIEEMDLLLRGGCDERMLREPTVEACRSGLGGSDDHELGEQVPAAGVLAGQLAVAGGN